MTTQHTPGPWAARDIDDDYSERQFWISDKDGALVAEASIGLGAQVEANARLIAAAPAMLEALQELIAEWDAQHADQDHRTGYTLDTYGVQLARSAIAATTKD